MNGASIRFLTMTLASASLLASPAMAEPVITALAPFEAVLDGRDELVGVAVDSDGVRYVSDRGGGIVYRIDATAAVTVAAASLDRPAGLALDTQGGLLIVEERAGRVRRLHAGTLAVVARGLNRPRWIAPDGDGAFYVSVEPRHHPDGGEVLHLAADGAVTVVATGINDVEGLARLNGDLLVASRGLAGHRTRAGTLLRYPVLAGGGLGAPVSWVSTGLQQPTGVAVDALASVYVTSKHATIGEDRAHRAVSKVHADAHVTGFASHLADPLGLAVAPDGALYVADGKSGRLLRFRAPAVPSLDPLAAATSAPTAVVSGITEAGARVDIFLDEVSVPVTVASEATGAFAALVTLTENSDNSLEVFATAHRGNGLSSPPAVASIAQDSVDPQVIFQAPLAGAYVRQTITVQARASDDGGAIASLTLRAAGQPLAAAVAPQPPGIAVTATGSWDSTTTVDGGQTLVADAVDHAGNTRSVTRAVIVDNTPPETQVTGHETDDASATFTVAGHDNLTPAGSLVFAWRLDGGSYSPFTGATSAAVTNVPEGTHTFEVKARDLAGNEDPTPATRTFTVLFGPVITAVAPASGSLGAFVTITGRNFEPGATVSFNGVAAVVRTVTPATITTTVPAGATTGSLAVTSSRGTATHPFTVTATADFTIAAAPATVRAIAGDEAAVTISVAGGGAFTSLATLRVSPTPSGVTARLGSTFVAPGAATSLTLRVAGTTPGIHPFTVSGEAQVDGRTLVRTVNIALEVLPPDTPAVTGRVLTAESIPRPIPGVTVALGTGFTVTDAAGNFVVLSPATGVSMLLLDGRTAGTPQAQFPVVEVQVDVRASGPTRLPFVVYLPILDNANPIDLPLDSTGFTTRHVDATTPLIPGLAVTIPQGTRIIGPDGNPVSQLVITPVPVDRTPMPFPDGVVPSLLFAINPGGSAPSKALPITFPNLTKAPPGATADLWYFDLVAGAWTVWGTGTVTADGTQIASDPGYGLPRLAWHFAFTISTSDEVRARHARAGEPVDLVTGRFVADRMDLVLPARIPITIQRTYRSESSTKGLFGVGWNLGVYDSTIALLGQGPSLMLILADQSSYVLTPRGAEWRNTGEPFLRGAVVTALPGDFNFQIRYKDGTIHRYRRLEGFLAGALVSISDRNGNTLTITRAGGLFVRRITQIVEPAGRAMHFTYDAAERITAITDPLHRVVRYAYDADGRLETVIDTAGGVTRYTYDAGHRILTITDARGITYLSNEYDVAGRVVRQTQADGGVWRFDYVVPAPPAASRAAAPLSPAAHARARGRSPAPARRAEARHFRRAQSELMLPPRIVPEPVPPVLPRFAFNASTPPPPASTTVTDPRGHATTYRFNAAGFTVSETNALGQTTTYEYDAANHLRAVRDPLGRVTGFTYDSGGNVLTVTDAAGHSRAFTYDPLFSRVRTVTDALGHTVELRYDARGNPTAIVDARGKAMTLEYDGFGQAVRLIDPLGQTVALEYDAEGNLAEMVDPLGRRSRNHYDAASRLIRRVNAGGQATVVTYDALNRVRRIVDALGGLTTLAYDPNGTLREVIDARGSVTSYEPDSMDRVAVRTDPLSRAESYGYDLTGNLTRVTDRKGQVTTSAYDALNRLVEVVYDDGTSTRYIYDAAGRLVQVVDSHGGTIVRAYDALDRLLIEATSQGAVAYTYDEVGRRRAMTVAGQPPLSYGYDEADRLTSITQAASTVTFEHDDANRRTRVTLPNGIATEYAYDAASQLTALTYRRGAVTLGDLTYAYDTAGGRQSVGGTWARTGRPQSATASYDAANRGQRFGDDPLAYDANGNLAHDGTSAYVWDARNRLAGVTGPTRATFGYDALRRRMHRTVGGATTTYLYDGLNVVQEHTGDGVTAVLTGLRIDEHLMRSHPDGMEAILADALGSTIALIDGAGETATQYTYEPFGATTATGAPTANAFTYTGREDDGTGLKYYRARYYHSGLHRFISEDPIEFDGGLNLYEYVFSNPLGWVDPSGLDIRISIYSCCAGATHIGLGVNSSARETVGFRPRRRHVPMARGEISADITFNPEGPIDSIEIVTTPEQDQIVRNAIERRTRRPGLYILGGRDCGTFVRGALNEAGIETVNVAIPRSVFSDLQTRVLNGEDFRRFVRP
jgi:RHS repeat-associated protein